MFGHVVHAIQVLFFCFLLSFTLPLADKLCGFLQSIGLSQYAAVFAKVRQCDIYGCAASSQATFHSFPWLSSSLCSVSSLLHAQISLVLTGRD